mmetsp:Transcript_20271/g.48040  ORF Transcript_20271/g.48040 Transcript_20271/m.48040 type:complete len:388 (-) Transcript_20271:161-1324(-)
MAIKKALHHTCMGKIVVDSSELVLHALEARIHRQPGRVHIVQHFRHLVLKGFDGLVNLRVSLPQRLDGLEGGGHQSAHVPQAFSVVCQEGREGQVRVPYHQRIRHGVDELQAVEPADTKQSGMVRRCLLGVLGLLWDHLPRGLLQQLRHGPGARVLPQHIAELLVASLHQAFHLILVQLPPDFPGFDHIHLVPAAQDVLPREDQLVVDLLRRRLGILAVLHDLAPNVGLPPRLCHHLDILQVGILQDIPHGRILREHPAVQELLPLWLHRRLLLQAPALVVAFIEAAIGLIEHALQAQASLHCLAHVLRDIRQLDIGFSSWHHLVLCRHHLLLCLRVFLRLLGVAAQFLQLFELFLELVLELFFQLQLFLQLLFLIEESLRLLFYLL